MRTIIDDILSKIVPLPKIEEQKRFLFIGPHPDDIEIGCGGTVARLTAEGKEVAFLVCTDGCYGINGKSKEETAAIRRIEATEAAKLIGVTRVEFLPFHDGGTYGVTEMTEEIMKKIAEYQPDMIFCPDDKSPTELHPDHVKVGQAAGFAFMKSGNAPTMEEYGLQPTKLKGIAYYFTHKPNRYFNVSRWLHPQILAIKKHESQFPTITLDEQEQFKMFRRYLHFRAWRFGLRCGKKYAEGYRVLGTVHTHCAPEADRL